MDDSEIQRIAESIKEKAKDVSFLSEIEIPVEDVVAIRDDAVSLIYKSFIDREGAIVLVSYYLVDLGIRTYDRGFWPHLDNETKVDWNQKDHDNIVKIFYRGLEILGLSLGKELDYRRNVDKIMMHTLVPDKKEYQDRFFNFIYNYYHSVLEDNVPEDCDQHFDELSRYVKSVRNGDTMLDLSELSEVPDPRTLNVCTQLALSDPELFKGLLLKILTIIDAGSQKNDMSYLLGSNRYAEPFNEWFQEKFSKKSQRKRLAEQRARRPHLILSYGNDFKPAMVIPARKCPKGSQIEFIIKNKVIKPPNQPQIIDVGPYTMMRAGVTYSLNSLNLSPFDKFTVKLGDKELFTNSSKKQWKVFDDDYSEVPLPSTGTSFFIFKDPSYNPNSENSIRFAKESGTYIADIEDGTEITLMGEKILVTDDNYIQNEDGIIAKIREGVTAVKTENKEYLPIITDDKILCRLMGSLKKSRITVEARLNGEAFIIPIRNVKQGSYSMDFLIEHDAIKASDFSELELTVRMDDVKKLYCRYLLIRNFDFDFDAENGQYTDSKSGTLTVVSPIESMNPIDTMEKTFTLSNYNGQSKYDLVFDIPSIFVSYGGSDWRGPGDYDVSINEFYGDNLVVRCTDSIRLYSKGFSPFERSMKDGDYVFDTSQFKEKIEIGKNYDVNYSINGKRSTHLFTLYTSNSYDISDKGKLSVSMRKNTKMRSFFRLSDRNSEIKHGELLEGDNVLLDPINEYVKLVIFESSEEQYSRNMVKSGFYGNPYGLKVTRDGFIVYFNEENVPLVCDKTEESFRKQFQRASNFNKWMKNLKVENYLSLLRDLL